MNANDELIKQLFEATMDRSDEDPRAFLDAAAVQPDVRAPVEALLGAHDRAATFLETPAIAEMGRGTWSV